MIEKTKTRLWINKYRARLRTGGLILEIFAPFGLFLSLSSANNLLSVLSGVLILAGLILMVVIG
ncbi:MAG: hypothetical protein ABIG43_00690 [Chloroflexota bacterium]